MSEERDPEEAKRTGTRNMAAFEAAVPTEVRIEAARLPQQLELMNARAGAKIRRLHLVTDRVYANTAGHVACRRGCAHCCHAAVVISRAEAAYIGERIGRAPADIRESRPPDVKRFSGATPCVFLRESECTIYEHRPMPCREALNFDVDNYWCRPENWHKPGAVVPKPTIPPLHEAYRVACSKGGMVIADIREWFPAKDEGGNG